MKELFPDRGVMAIAHGVHEAAAVAAEMLHGPFLRGVSLVRHEEAEDEDEEPDDDRDGEALEAPLDRLKGEGRPGDAHSPAWDGIGKRVGAETRLNRKGTVTLP
jgi:hypothetical protein